MGWAEEIRRGSRLSFFALFLFIGGTCSFFVGAERKGMGGQLFCFSWLGLMVARLS